MDVNKLIITFEQLKKYIFIINRDDNKRIVIKFTNDKFYHLVGLHKMNLEQFFPTHIKAKSKRYKYIKNNPEKFNNVLNNQFKRKELLELRVNTFSNILDLLNGFNTSLYNLKSSVDGSMYDGDYGLSKMYQNDICCLLGLKIDNENENIINCVPNSWMASNRINKLVQFKRPIYMHEIIMIPIEMYDENNNTVFA